MSALPDERYIQEEGIRLLAEARAGGPVPRPNPKSIRMPEGLLPWFERYAGAEGITVNGALVLALEAFKAAVERGRAGEQK